MGSILTALVILSFISLSNALPTIMKLEPSLPMGMRSNLTHLQLSDRERQQRTRMGAANLTLEGSLDTSNYGFYYTKLKIGSPSREFTLKIDTGSEISWVSCNGCHSCPKSNDFGTHLQAYNPNTSSSASVISAFDKQCRVVNPGASNSQHPRCHYVIEYEDQSRSGGFLVSDIFHLDSIVNATTNTQFSTSVVFGCTYNRSGNLAASHDAVDGMLGLNTGGLSLISQLSLPVFSHCLRGRKDGGGILILGEILKPNIVYTPLDLSGQRYDLNLQSIAVNGEIVQIDPAVFDSKNGGGTTVDSGTSFAMLAEHAYGPFINALTSIVPQSGQPVKFADFPCFNVSSRIDDVFPLVSFNFEGGASMTVKPKDYTWEIDLNGTRFFCICFGKSTGESASTTTLGDVVLIDKIVVYDIAHNRLGWASHDCSKPVNVSSEISASSSTIDTLLISTGISILSLFLYLVMFD